MATVYQTFQPQDFVPASTNGAQQKSVDGTNFPVDSLAFDGGSTDETAYLNFSAINYGSGNVTLDIIWYADTASSGNVRFGGALAVITPNTDTQDVETDAFATATEANDTHLGTTGQRLHKLTITLTNLDSLAANDEVWLQLYREASDTVNDTMTGDCLVTKVIISYSDT